MEPVIHFQIILIRLAEAYWPHFLFLRMLLKDVLIINSKELKVFMIAMTILIKEGMHWKNLVIILKQSLLNNINERILV